MEHYIFQLNVKKNQKTSQECLSYFFPNIFTPHLWVINVLLVSGLLGPKLKRKVLTLNWNSDSFISWFWALISQNLERKINTYVKSLHLNQKLLTTKWKISLRTPGFKAKLKMITSIIKIVQILNLNLKMIKFEP